MSRSINASVGTMPLHPKHHNDGLLVIVDMQDRYAASRPRKVRSAVAAEITAAKANGWWIIVLEFGGTTPHSHTHSSLKQQLDGYQRCLPPLIKHEADGSKLVKAACRQRLLAPRRVRVCGVNIDGCVQATVRGLVLELPETVIEVVKKASNSTSAESSWQSFMTHPRVWIV